MYTQTYKNHKHEHVCANTHTHILTKPLRPIHLPSYLPSSVWIHCMVLLLLQPELALSSSICTRSCSSSSLPSYSSFPTACQTFLSSHYVPRTTRLCIRLPPRFRWATGAHRAQRVQWRWDERNNSEIKATGQELFAFSRDCSVWFVHLREMLTAVTFGMKIDTTWGQPLLVCEKSITDSFTKLLLFVPCEQPKKKEIN